MKNNKYIELNSRIRAHVKDLGLEYLKQYSHNGPRVARTKFYGLMITRKTLKRLVARLRGTGANIFGYPFLGKHIKDVKYTSGRPWDKYQGYQLASLTVYYK